MHLLHFIIDVNVFLQLGSAHIHLNSSFLGHFLHELFFIHSLSLLRTYPFLHLQPGLHFDFLHLNELSCFLQLAWHFKDFTHSSNTSFLRHFGGLGLGHSSFGIHSPLNLTNPFKHPHKRISLNLLHLASRPLQSLSLHLSTCFSKVGHSKNN